MSLFEDIQKQFCVLYISDIHYMPLWKDVIIYVLQLKNESYSQTEWIDLIEYLTGVEQQKNLTIDQCKMILTKLLNDPKEVRKH